MLHLNHIVDETQENAPTFAPVGLADDAGAEIAEWIDAHRRPMTDRDLDQLWAHEMEARELGLSA